VAPGSTQEPPGLADTSADVGGEGYGEADGGRLVAVAIDAAGAAGTHGFTYRVPRRLEPLADGEAVLVEFGRRQALGIVLGAAAALVGVEVKPVLDRVRADGPLLAATTMALALDISSTYLAPPAIVIRAMLPPGLLERLELVAEARPGAPGQRAAADPAASAPPVITATGAPLPDPDDAAILAQLIDGPRPVRRLRAPEGRAGLLRRLRALRAAALIDLDWTLLDAGAGPRHTRIASLAASPDTSEMDRPGPSPARLGPRQRAALVDLEAAGREGIAVPELSSRHGGSVVRSLVGRGLVEITVVEAPRRPLAARPPGRRGARPANASLSPMQAAAVDAIVTAMTGGDPRPILLDGATGGGKTAIYAAAIDACLAFNRRALVLVPEIALALPLVDRLRADLGAEIGLVHSGLSEGERADEWRRIRAGAVDVVVGTRLAVLAPVEQLGLIVVDEEHDAAYKSDRTPRLQARDVAVRLATLAGAAVVLGSATPAVETEGRARDGRYRRFHLGERLSGLPPRVEVVDLRAELAAGVRGMLSRPLGAALAALDVAAGEQGLLVINRRGSASVVLCRDCGTVQACPDCTRPLVYHQAGITLRCHHCGRATPLARRCPTCGSARIRYLGGGTERLEREVRDAFPGLRVARLDRDVAERRGAAARILDALSEGQLDVLVGTSLVTKGLDVPSITLVGVVSADVALNLPDERAAERTYQLLAQAVGRAGRGDRPGHAIIQSYQPDHPAIIAVARDEPAAFYDAELELRQRFGSPPFGRLVKLTVAIADRTAAEAAATEFATRLRDRSMALDAGVEVAGPAPAYVARRADRWRYNVVLRGIDPLRVLGDPPGPPWSIDVDPESLL
jgi:primosomal protein N' (replication factor Y)